MELRPHLPIALGRVWTSSSVFNFLIRTWRSADYCVLDQLRRVDLALNGSTWTAASCRTFGRIVYPLRRPWLGTFCAMNATETNIESMEVVEDGTEPLPGRPK